MDWKFLKHTLSEDHINQLSGWRNSLKKFKVLLEAINKADSSKELKVLKSDFHGDLDRNQLESELHPIPAIFKQSTPVDFCKIYKTFQYMDEDHKPCLHKAHLNQNGSSVKNIT